MFLRDPKTKAIKWIAKEHHDKLMAEQEDAAENHRKEAARKTTEATEQRAKRKAPLRIVKAAEKNSRNANDFSNDETR